MTRRAAGLLWLVAAALVGAALWLRATRGDRTSEAEPVVSPTLLRDAASIESIDSGGSVELVLGGSTWHQALPFVWPIDTLAVRDLLGALERLTVVRRASGHEAPRESAPRLLIRDLTGNGIELALEGRAPGGRAWIHTRSVGAAGPGAWSRLTTRDHVHEFLERVPPRSWRDPTLLGGLGAECTSIELRSPSLQAPIRVERAGAAWRLTSPAATRAAAASVEAWMDSLARLRATSFIRDTPDRDAYGLATPLAHLSIGSAGGGTDTLVVGGEMGRGQAARDRYARLERIDSVVALDDVALRQLEPNVVGLVDPVACGVRAPDIFTIRFMQSPGDGDVRSASGWELHRDGFGWKGELANGHAAAVLHAMTDVPASEIAFIAMPSGTILGRLELVDIDGEVLASLVVGREADQATRWAVEAEAGVLRVFPPSWGEGLGFSQTP